jgi:hypothetical protein
VADAEAIATPPVATTAGQGAIAASARSNGANTSAIAPITASIFACRIARGGTGADATRSGASSPDTASQASPPASWPAPITSTGTTRMYAAAPEPKLFHNSSAGGSR